MAKQPKYVEDAVEAFQKVMGATELPIKVQTRLYGRALKLCHVIASKKGMDISDVTEQIVREAGRRGKLTPLAGKDR